MSDKETQAMPHDGKKGAPDGVNTQAEYGATGGSDDGAPHPGGHKPNPDADGFMGHGGQSTMGYHGSGQLGEKKTKPGGNGNAGSRSD